MDYVEYRDLVLKEITKAVSLIEPKEIEDVVEEILRAGSVYCDGRGRSGIQLESFVMRLSQMKKNAYLVSGITTTAIGANDLLVICSASGETESVVQHARKAKGIGSKVVLLTTNANSTAAKYSDSIIVVNAPTKKAEKDSSIQPLGALFEQTESVLLDIIVLMIMERCHISNEDMKENHNNLE